MKRSPTSEYVLGTHDAERKRLGLQHSVWRPKALECWQRAGIRTGSKVVDVGCGPGHATMDLAEIVADGGRVVAVDQAQRFVEATSDWCQARNYDHVGVHQIDLMKGSIPARDFDAAWTRWVACFLPNPETLLASISATLRVGGVAIFHEYVDYATWKFSPACPILDEFVQLVMDSWREFGGEPDIARVLPSLLSRYGLELYDTRPHVFCCRPSDYVWQWPAAFLDTNLRRLHSLGFATKEWCATVRNEMIQLEQNRDAMMMTPMVLEILARKT